MIFLTVTSLTWSDCHFFNMTYLTSDFLIPQERSSPIILALGPPSETEHSRQPPWGSCLTILSSAHPTIWQRWRFIPTGVNSIIAECTTSSISALFITFIHVRINCAKIKPILKTTILVMISHQLNPATKKLHKLSSVTLTVISTLHLTSCKLLSIQVWTSKYHLNNFLFLSFYVEHQDFYRLFFRFGSWRVEAFGDNASTGFTCGPGTHKKERKGKPIV